MKTTLFDLDGTLTDPGPGLANCVKYAFDRLQKPCPAPEVLTRFIGPPLRLMFSALLETGESTLIEEAVTLYRERYSEIGVYETELYDGIEEMLELSGNISARCFVITSKPTLFAKRIIAHLRLERYFNGVYGPELDGTFDNKADLIRHVLEVERISNGDAIMVGDRAADIVAARANALGSIGTLWGYGSSDELRVAGANMLCRVPSELPSCLREY